MDKIASFTIDHIKLEPGLYVSRIDRFGETFITTFDIRITSPNDEPVLNTAELHTIEHLCATYARNDKDWAEKIVYFGPMGCRTGCYLLVEGKLSSREMVPFMTKMFEFVRDFEGDIPGAKPEECGNYLDQNLPMAKFVAKRYLENTLYNIDDAHLNYPA
ncbi:MAG: S-ribosylhomocysteine lyase [Spirochaetales bacterium]|nr:S-ribosylhomocysteine lyase [Spirochaetales bacterium]